jgi:hypothetical protein
MRPSRRKGGIGGGVIGSLSGGAPGGVLQYRIKALAMPIRHRNRVAGLPLHRVADRRADGRSAVPRLWQYLE